MSRWVVVVGAALGASGCESAACDRWFDALSALQVRCGQPSQPGADAAKARFRTACLQRLALPGQALTAAKLTACADALASASCRLGPLTDCDSLLGAQPPGTACNDDGQCDTGRCERHAFADGGVASCGTCQPTKFAGQPCGPTDHCARGTDCAAGSCVAYGTASDGRACAQARDCAAGFGCDATGHCAKLGALNATCTANSDCGDGLACLNGTCKAQLDPGAACVEGQCKPGLVCDQSQGKCLGFAWAAAGAKCGPASTLELVCLLGSCVVSDLATGSGTCPTVVDDGQPCARLDRTQTCGAYASCLDGACVLKEEVCK